eukprot:m.1075878 g.1075878  ORF g.1075878 m.1075878 type:complete len:80 (-) comp24245_c0_seq7:296-535(-)
MAHDMPRVVTGDSYDSALVLHAYRKSMAHALNWISLVCFNEFSHCFKCCWLSVVRLCITDPGVLARPQLFVAPGQRMNL